MSRGAIVSINLSALKHNYTKIQQLTHHRSIIAMIKSNGYGHGLLRMANQLSQASALGVACLDEALVLREAGIKNNIICMEGFFDASEIPIMQQHQLIAVIHQSEQIAQLEKANIVEPLSVWLKIDTGMHRLGFPVDNALSAYEQLKNLAQVKTPIGLMTHLADADNTDRAFTETQIKKFNEITAKLSGPKSIVNSAGIMAYPKAHADWVRPGIMLYGVSPFSQRTGVEEGLQPVMTLRAKIISIQHCQQGDAVGYGCTWHCPEAMPVGIVGIGYGDGYPRHAPNGTPTLIHGKICPLIGRVSMDMIAVDLRPLQQVAIDDPVVLWGEGLPVEKIAAQAGTIGYELLCGVTQRVKFIEVNS